MTFSIFREIRLLLPVECDRYVAIIAKYFALAAIAIIAIITIIAYTK